MSFILGIDIGTTGCKALLINESGQLSGKGYMGYRLHTLPDGFVEQDPADWYAAACSAVHAATANVDKQEIIALSLSTQGASSCIVDPDGHPLGRAITWMDTRATQQLHKIQALINAEDVYKKTGWPLSPTLDLAKIRWLKDHYPSRLKQGNRFISTLEYMNFQLTGEWAIDPTNGAMRQLMNINTCQWDQDLLNVAGISEEQLTPIKKSGDFIGFLTRSAASDLELTTKTKVYNGGHDQYCGVLGANIRDPGDLMLSTGTAWVILAITEKPVFSKSYIAPGPHLIEGLYGALASLPTAGTTLDWMRGKIGGIDYAQIDRETKDRRIKNKDSFLYPYMTGTGFPLWQTKARSTVTGLDLDSDKIDLALLCMEGAVFQWRKAIDEYIRCGIPIKRIKVIGGACNSPVWLSLLAALSPCDIQAMPIKDTPAVGAAMLAGSQSGLWSDQNNPITANSQLNESLSVDYNISAFYKEKYDKYCSAWQKIQAIYD